MGVDCRLYLPLDVGIDDVAKVMAILAGRKPKKKSLEPQSDSTYVNAPGYKIQPRGDTLSEIILKSPIPLYSEDAGIGVYWHWQVKLWRGTDYPEPYAYMLGARSYTFWVAMAIKLAEFFGGWIDLKDCDSVYADLVYEKPRKENSPEDDPGWQAFQDEMAKVRPLTENDLKLADALAAYKLDGSRG